ncbi:unnamed protein product [Blepharisma stoltei]|uniref:USP domain-containing protein n=1 Tax=Blepharisma stoltei TaxID=1481888 RepID=A0AAU9JLR8_9CILI|nr:unnamed protein product [Blepharisma stoltei]
MRKTCRMCAQQYRDEELHKRFCKRPLFAGFTNNGANNCFLNSALQILYNIKTFRDSVNQWNEKLAHSPSEDCVTCSVKSIFHQYANIEAQNPVLDASSLRSQLSTVYSKQNKFQLNDKADAMEALIAILNAFHCSEIGNDSQGVDEKTCSLSCRHQCPSHIAFNLEVLEQLQCICGSTSEATPWDISTYMQTFYAQDLLKKSRTNSHNLKRISYSSIALYKDESSVLPFLKKFAMNLNDVLFNSQLDLCANDSENCIYKKSKRKIYAVDYPRVYMVNIAWHELIPRRNDTLKLIASLPDKLNLKEIYGDFHSPDTSHYLRGFILYGLGHYIACLLNLEDLKWYKFDDTVTEKIKDGGKYDMVSYIIKRGMHPVGVFYERLEKDHRIPELSESEWLAFEKWTLMIDEDNEEVRQMTEQILKQAQSLRIHGIDKNDLPGNEGNSSNKDKEKVREEDSRSQSQETITWECACGSKNPETFLICKSCSSPKLGLKGWVCKSCTFLNQIYESNCEACSEAREETKTKTSSNMASESSSSNREAITKSSWKCICGNENYLSHCWKCGENRVSYELCSICKSIIVSDFYCKNCDLKLSSKQCYRCTGPNEIICRSCFQSSWKCPICNARTFESLSICSMCGHNKISQRTDSTLSSLPLSSKISSLGIRDSYSNSAGYDWEAQYSRSPIRKSLPGYSVSNRRDRYTLDASSLKPAGSSYYYHK